jgi:translation initiation factor 5
LVCDTTSIKYTCARISSNGGSLETSLSTESLTHARTHAPSSSSIQYRQSSNTSSPTMSSSVNIAGLTPVNDPSYRYKMPRLTAKVEGRGNGIKTVLMNIVEVGSSLNRPPDEIAKFFGCQLGSRTEMDVDERHIVSGDHAGTPVKMQALQTHLSRYIELFVLCRKCRLPETDYKFESENIYQTCKACGHSPKAPVAHKLTTYMLAQHKKAKDGDSEKSKKEDQGPTAGGGAVVATEDTADKKKKKDKKKETGDDIPDKEGRVKKKSSKKESEAADEEPVDENVFGIEEEETDSAAARKSHPEYLSI